MNWRDSYRKAVTFSYDDGNEQDVRLVKLFNDYGVKATFNVNTGLDGTNGTWKYKDIMVHRLNLEEAGELYRGHEIAVHGLTHMNLAEAEEEQIRREIFEDIRNIGNIFGKKPVGMAYPYGAYGDTVLRIVREAGLGYARGTCSTGNFQEQRQLLCFRPTCHHDDDALFELADRFLSMEAVTPRIFYIWGHSYEFEGNRNWSRMERFLERISGRKDIFYGTNQEVLCE